ncbi:MAG TPA: FkbM family methyltransferase [Solirubrobacteraceae bacterium]|jgi:FkbM family methyltransferase
MLGDRSPGFVLAQAMEPDNYRALWRMPRTVRRPVDFAGRYFLGRGEYPSRCEVNTPAGVIAPTLYSHHDVFTVNEIFCRLDYRLRAGARTVVDVGSNIGISALYFLTRSPDVRCHLFEPDPRNVERLRANLEGYRERYVLTEAAVSDRAGRVSFGLDPTGRYGGVGLRHAQEIEVDCLSINDVLRTVIELDGRVDMLKLDTEGLENRTVQAIEPDLLERIAVICFETTKPINPDPRRFELRYATDTARLINREPAL